MKELIEPNYGLLDQLLSLGILSHGDIANIQSRASIDNENQLLLEYMAEKNEIQCECFITALERTNQQHVANYIRRNGGNNWF